jgi:acylphosphatase
VSVLRLVISGRVQGVGYRDWLVKRASRLGLSGWVRNRDDGGVEAVLAGEAALVAECLEACWRGPMLAVVREIETVELELVVEPGFRRLPTG